MKKEYPGISLKLMQIVGPNPVPGSNTSGDDEGFNPTRQKSEKPKPSIWD